MAYFEFFIITRCMHVNMNLVKHSDNLILPYYFVQLKYCQKYCFSFAANRVNANVLNCN